MKPVAAIFLDKDGTLVYDRPYNIDPHAIQLLPGVAEGLSLFKTFGFKLVVVSNQAGIAHGYFNEEALAGVQAKLHDLFGQAGVTLDGFYWCPHHPEGKDARYRQKCFCRKPRPGLLLRAARELNIDLTSSWMIGDILDDVEAGRRAGCRTVFLDSGNETEWVRTPKRIPHFTVTSFAAASHMIVNQAATKMDGLYV